MGAGHLKMVISHTMDMRLWSLEFSSLQIPPARRRHCRWVQLPESDMSQSAVDRREVAEIRVKETELWPTSSSHHTLMCIGSCDIGAGLLETNPPQHHTQGSFGASQKRRSRQTKKETFY